MRIDYMLSAHDDGYRIADWFHGGDATLAAASRATPAGAEAILRDAYRGPDCDGVTVSWTIDSEAL